MSLLEDFVAPKNYALIALKWLNGVLAVSFFVGFLFFTFQTTTVFSFIHKAFDLKPPYVALEKINDEVLKSKTDLNFYKYRSLKVEIDKLTFFGDAYRQAFNEANSMTSSNSEKLDAKERMALISSEIKSSVKQIVEFYAIPLEENLIRLDDKENTVEFANSLKDKISKEIEQYGENESIEKRNLNQMIGLVTNGALKNIFTSIDIDSLNEQETADFLASVVAEASNDFTAIDSVKKDRVDWSEVMNEIEQRTIAVDNYFSDEFYNELGGIRYTSYDFDSNNRSLTLLGDTKSFETTNFSMIANLIDELNRSEMFSNAEMKSFNKTGSFSEGYSATLKVTMDLDE